MVKEAPARTGAVRRLAEPRVQGRRSERPEWSRKRRLKRKSPANASERGARSPGTERIAPENLDAAGLGGQSVERLLDRRVVHPAQQVRQEDVGEGIRGDGTRLELGQV